MSLKTTPSRPFAPVSVYSYWHAIGVLGPHPAAARISTMPTPPINQWPRHERPRERILSDGAEGLTDAEILAVLLGCGGPGQSAVDLAHELLARFGGLRGLFSAGTPVLLQLKGVGPGRAALLRAARECAVRYLQERLRPGQTITSPASSREFLLARLRDRPHEVFCALFMDNRHRVLAFDELFRGTIDSTTVYPREVVKQALARNAAAVILAHNHPSGVAEPSEADQIITRRVRDALALVDVRLLDHFVVGDGTCISLAARGVI